MKLQPTSTAAATTHEVAEEEELTGPSSSASSSSQTQSEGSNQNAISSIVSQLLDNNQGEPVGTQIKTQNQVTLTEGIPLGATVSAKLKTKIWTNEYFDLRNLLSNQEEDPLMLSISPGVINVQHTLKAEPPMSINQWTDSFLIFMCIRLERNPLEAPHLLKYMSMIREMHRLYGEAVWRAYDESFRKLRESVEHPWQKPIEELRSKCFALAFRSPQASQPFRAKQAGRVRFCFAFNQGEKCKNTPCKFSHTCQTCRGQHPKYKCTSPQRASNAGKTKFTK